MSRHLLALPTLLSLLMPSASPADNWPEFRGPTAQGVVRHGRLPTEWAPDKNVTWKQTIPGNGWSSPVLWGGRVYLTTSVPDGKDLSLRALCLDAATGKVVWDKEAIRQEAGKAPRIHGKNTDASATPVVDGKRLYAHFGHLGTACLDLDGNVVWRNTELRYAPVHGNGGSPVLVDDLLVFSIDGADKQAVVALDRGTGFVRWQTDRQSRAVKTFSFGTPLVIEVGGAKQVVSQGSNVVSALDPKTGLEVWKVRTTGYSVVPRPVFGHGLLFVCTGFDAPSLLAIRPDGKGDVTDTHVAWKTSRNVPLTPSPLLHGDELYLISDRGVASCLDAKTGKVHWEERVGGNHSSSPLVADGKVYFQSEEGVGTVVRAATTFARVAKNDMKERTLASCAAADGSLYLRTETHLYRIDAPAEKGEN